MKSLAEDEKIKREVWGLKEIPFPDVPPNDPAQVARFFVGRDEEYAKARTYLYRGENVLVRGTWGIGKTAFMLATLHRLQQEAQGQEKSVRSVYIKEFRGGPVVEFYQVVLHGLRSVMPISFWDRLWGLRPQELGVKVLSVLEAKWKTEEQESAVLDQIDSLFQRGERERRQVVVAVDDLDKTTLQQGTINAMLRDALHILRNRRCGFILTGRAITRLDDLEISQLGVVSEIIPLKPLSDDELRQTAVRQLNLVRNQPCEDTFPFNDEVITEMARKSVGIPRVFYRLCKKTLDIAARLGYEVIGRDEFDVCYREFQDDLSVQIPPDVKRILYYALRRNGFLISSKEETLEEVLPLVGATTVYDLVPYLDRLVRADYMVRVERPEGIRYNIAPGTERAAEEGAHLG